MVAVAALMMILLVVAMENVETGTFCFYRLRHICISSLSASFVLKLNANVAVAVAVAVPLAVLLPLAE